MVYTRMMLTGLLLALLSSAASAQVGPAIPKEKKLLGWACDWTDANYFASHIRDLEKLPLDGYVITVYPDDKRGQTESRHCMWFGGTRYTKADFSKTVARLRSARSKKLTDNFIDFETTVRDTSGRPVTDSDANLDWFDPSWPVITQKAGIAAWIAKQAGFKGIFLDVEPYGGGKGTWRYPFQYDTFAKYQTEGSAPLKSLSEYERMVRIRGREFMRAMVREYPTITIVVIPNTGWGASDLVATFVNGMLEVRGKASIVDGGEETYPAITYQDFISIRNLGDSYKNTPLRKSITHAFGVWVDNRADINVWQTAPANFDKNYRTPNDLENTLYGALSASDKYAWLFIWNSIPWWSPSFKDGKLENVPEEYVEAVRNSRKPHDLAWTPLVTTPRTAYFDDAVLVEGATITDASPNLLTNPGLEDWTTSDPIGPVGWIVSGQSPRAHKELTIKRSGNCSAAITSTLHQAHVFFDQHIPVAPFAGKTITFGAWIKSDFAGMGDVQILDFINNVPDVASSNSHPGNGEWVFQTATKTIRPNATGEVLFRLGARVPFVRGKG